MDIYFALQSDSDGTPLTGQAANVTVYISKDGGAYAATTNAAQEIGRGSYKVTLTSAEAAFSTLLYAPVCTGAQSNILIKEADPVMPTVPTAADNATAVWGAQTKEVTIATAQADTFATASALTTVGNNVSTIKAKTDNLPQNPAAVGSEMALTSAAISAVQNGLSTFDASTDTVTLTDAYDAAKTASQLTTSDLSALATSAEITALASVANDTLAGMLYWRVVDDTLITYGSNGSIRGQYTITKDSTGNIVKIEPIPSNDGN